MPLEGYTTDEEAQNEARSGARLIDATAARRDEPADDRLRAPRRRLRPRRAQRYLITGGAGFIGSHVAAALLERGDTVLVLDDLSSGSLDNLSGAIGSETLEFREGSVLDPQLVEECVAECDVVLHLASAVGVQLILEHALGSLLSNVRGTDNVLSAASRAGRRVVFASTSEVYGKNSECPVGEDADRVLGSSRKSRWGYSLAKSFGEALAHNLWHELDADTVTVRLFNTVGPRQRGSYGMVLPRFVNQALAGESLTVYGDGTQRRCFTHVTDVVDAMVRICDAEPAAGKIFNVGAETDVSVIELARRVIERSGSPSTVTFVDYETAFGGGFEELGHRVPDTTAIRDLTGWTPARSVDDAIDDVLHARRAAATTEAPQTGAVALER